MPGSYITPGPAAVTAGSIGSGSIASGQVAWVHHASGAVVSGQVGDNAVVSGSVASGIVGFVHLGNSAVQSGTVTSGQLFGMHLASGAVRSGHLGADPVAPYASVVMAENFTTMEIVSGCRAVFLSSGETVGVAQAGSGLRFPAFGVNASGALSGTPCRVVMFGRMLTDDTSQWSGKVGQALFVSQSGFQLTVTKPTSGNQRIGIALSGGLVVNPDLVLVSGTA